MHERSERSTQALPRRWNGQDYESMLEMRMWLLLQECKKAGIPVGSTRGEGVSEQGIDELARKLTLRWLKDNPVHVLRQGAYWKTGTLYSEPQMQRIRASKRTKQNTNTLCLRAHGPCGSRVGPACMDLGDPAAPLRLCDGVRARAARN